MEQRQPFLPENFFHAGQSAVGQSYAGSDPAAFNYAAQNPLADTNPAEYFFLKDRMGQDLYDKLERTANYEDLSLQQEHAYRFSWPSPLAQDYFLYVYCLSVCEFPQKFAVSKDGGEAFLLALTYTGSGVLDYEGRTYQLAPGTAFLIDCRKPYHYRAESKAWGYYAIYFDGHAAPAFFSMIREEDGVCFPVTENSSLAHSIRQLYFSNSVSTRHTEVENNQTLTHILTEILGIARSHTVTPPEIKEICTYLENHYREPINLDSLAAQFYKNKYHLSHLFKTYVGIPPNQYLNRVRLNRAKYFLVTSTLSIGEIAEAVGIHSANHFLYLFKKQEQMLPSEFRKRFSL